MSSQFPGFDKSAPPSLPRTRKQNSPISSWDLDLSPFEKLLEHHANNTRYLTETFSQKMSELVDIVRGEKKRNGAEALEKQIINDYKGLLTKLETTLSKNSQEQLHALEKINHNIEDRDKSFVRQMEEVRQDLTKVIHHCERIADTLEPMEKLAQENFKPTVQNDPRERTKNITFFILLGILLIFFFLRFIVPNYL